MAKPRWITLLDGPFAGERRTMAVVVSATGPFTVQGDVKGMVEVHTYRLVTGPPAATARWVGFLRRQDAAIPFRR